MDFREQSRVIFKCPVCGADIVERTTSPAPHQIELILEHAKPEPACRWLLESLAAERKRIMEKLIARTTYLLCYDCKAQYTPYSY